MLTSKYAAGLAFIGLVALPAAALAGSGYAFTVENNSPTAMTVYANGKSQCDIAPGKSCRVMVANADAHFAYAMAGGGQVVFDPGNLEAVDLCKVDSGGIHCIDPNAPN